MLTFSFWWLHFVEYHGQSCNLFGILLNSLRQFFYLLFVLISQSDQLFFWLLKFLYSLLWLFKFFFQISHVLFVSYLFVPLYFLKTLPILVLPILFWPIKLKLNLFFFISHISKFFIKILHLFMWCSVHFLNYFFVYLSLFNIVFCTQFSIISHKHEWLYILTNKLEKLLKIVLYLTETLNYWQNVIC